MLAYGGKAQDYFDHNTVIWADANIELEPAEAPAKIEPMTVNGSVTGLRFYGATMIFTFKNAVRYYFKTEAGMSMENYRFTVGTKELTVNYKDGMYFVEVDVINPQDLDNPIELKVTCGTEVLTVCYSAMHYIVRMYNGNASSELKVLLQDLYGYYMALIGIV